MDLKKSIEIISSHRQKSLDLSSDYLSQTFELNELVEEKIIDLQILPTDNRTPLENQLFYEIEANMPKTVENKLNSVGIQALRIIFSSNKAWMPVTIDPKKVEEPSSITLPRLEIRDN